MSNYSWISNRVNLRDPNLIVEDMVHYGPPPEGKILPFSREGLRGKYRLPDFSTAKAPDSILPETAPQ